jgi:hypothetical protein
VSAPEGVVADAFRQSRRLCAGFYETQVIRRGFLIPSERRHPNGYAGEGEHRFRREAERRSGAKVNSSRSEATLAMVIVE